jgi:hypothetical protein
MENSIKIYSLASNEIRTYLVSALFVIGNILLPQLCHLLPLGGPMWQPIYFFTLIGAYKFGWRVGLLTAILSPMVNTLLFDMPTMAVLPLVLIKSVTLAVVASGAARKLQAVHFVAMVGVVLAYQFIGGVIDALFFSSLNLALQSLYIALPGMFVQVIGGYFVIKNI